MDFLKEIFSNKTQIQVKGTLYSEMEVEFLKKYSLKLPEVNHFNI